MASVIAQPHCSDNGVVGDRSWKRYIDGGLEGISEAVVLEGGHRVKVSWVDGHESEYSLKWLRDHSDGSFHVNTKQRKLDLFSISNDTPIKHVSVGTTSPGPSSAADPSMDNMDSMGKGNKPQEVLQVRWDADGNEEKGGECTLPIARLRQYCTSETALRLRKQFGASTEVEKPDPAPVSWGKDVFSSVAGNTPTCFEYTAVMEDQPSSPASSSSPSQTAACQLRGLLKSHGVALVRGTPPDVAGIVALGRKIGGRLMSTIFGETTWSVSTEAVKADYSFRDAAYTTDAFALHTDGPFYSDPPGLQVLTCHVKSPEGGANVCADGFAVAERLRKEHPKAFEFFTTTPLKFQYCGDESHFIAEAPIIRLNPLGVVDQVRFSDTYRSPLDYLSTGDIDRYYEHHQSLMSIMRDPSMLARILLEPGDALIFNNQRALHGRETYKGARRMVGCYVKMDEANSEARMRGI